ncbi:hypothetical protein [Phormidium nigroviride]|uniref:hypothetical protein n=1 Tax=Phormidium nigroviride TaxID=482564 RepID=UPI00167F2996|nr:hypothetical protein [Oscillatoria nigro-viridis]
MLHKAYSHFVTSPSVRSPPLQQTETQLPTAEYSQYSATANPQAQKIYDSYSLNLVERSLFLLG